MTRHIRQITIKRAEEDDDIALTTDDVSGILDQVFGFVLDLVSTKGKGPEQNQNGQT